MSTRLKYANGLEMEFANEIRTSVSKFRKQQCSKYQVLNTTGINKNPGLFFAFSKPSLMEGLETRNLNVFGSPKRSSTFMGPKAVIFLRGRFFRISFSGRPRPGDEGPVSETGVSTRVITGLRRSWEAICAEISRTEETAVRASVCAKNAPGVLLLLAVPRCIWYPAVRASGTTTRADGIGL